MKSLLNIYENIYQDVVQWNYYNSTPSYGKFNKLITNKPLHFIRWYLKCWAKLQFIDKYFKKIKSLPDADKRIEHIVSLFFLGIYIYENIGFISSNIDKGYLIQKYFSENSKLPACNKQY